jgi:hypothetical protein
MTPIRAFFLLLSLLTLAVSCSSVKSSNKKMLTGVWQNVRYAEQDPGQENDEIPTGRETSPDSVEPSSGGAIIKSMEFRSDQTATITYTDKALNGTWKLDRTGNIILFTEIPGGNTIRLQVSRLSADGFGLVESEQGKDVIIKYLRKE